jgi:hypothetical protein
MVFEPYSLYIGAATTSNGAFSLRHSSDFPRFAESSFERNPW